MPGAKQHSQMRPEAEEYVGQYVKAIHDFPAGGQGEITLKTGDIFKVTRVVDKNWLHGTGHGQEGNFPTDFVKKILVPVIEDNQKLFAATDNFPAQQDGDLEFRKGQVIVGLHPVDANWWQGQVESQVGIFPLTHVMELEQSKLLRQRSKSVHATEPLFARALVDSVAQLDEELGFVAGEIITVTEVIDEDWYQGEVGSRSGMFLAACVELLNDTTENEIESNNNKPCSSFSEEKKENSPKTTSQQESNQTRPKSISFSDSVEVRSTQDVSPAIETQSSDYVRTMSYTSENTKSHGSQDTGVTPYARTLYQFNGELADELSFGANDIVTLIQHLDEQWIEGELDGKIGLFPANFVEIVVDCPYAYPSNQSDTSELITAESQYANESQKEVQNENGTISQEEYALVKFTFQAESGQDLTVQEGDTVTVIKRIDQNWVMAKDDAGNQGLCPVDFLEMIGSSPDHHVDSIDHNKLKNSHESSKQNGGSAFKKSQSQVVSGTSQVASQSPQTQSESQEKSKPLNGMTGSQSLGSLSSLSKPKPPIKPKPQIAPKPSLKPKPLVSPKPFTPSVLVSSPASSSSNSDTVLPKSASTKSLTDYDSNLTETKAKSQSMSEINRLSAGVVSTSELTSSTTASSTDNLPDLNSSAEIRDSLKSNGKKVFENWDFSKPLNSLLKDEFKKAENEAARRSRSSSNKSSDSTDSNDKDKLADVDETDGSFMSGRLRPFSWAGTKAVESPHSKTANYSRENFSEDLNEDESGIKIGNSVFFSDITSNSVKPVPGHTGKKVDGEMTRKPSLRKPPPPRPVGPKLAPLPSKTPMTPSKPPPPSSSSSSSSSGLVPRRPAPAVPLSTSSSSLSKPKGVVQKHSRPAPPRPPPGQARKSATKPSKGDNQSSAPKPVTKGDNLMSFSSNSSVDMSECSDPEAAAELRARITEMEKDLEQCKKSKEELHMMSTNVEEGEETEIHDNIQFYEENIAGITKELQSLRENLSQLCPQEQGKIDQERLLAARREEEEERKEEMRKKMALEKKERRENREKVINELLQTEKDFIQSLNVIMETFLGPASEKHPDVDLELLFGNIEEVADVSQRLLTKLEAAVNGRDFSHQVIGVCFTALAEDMKNVYAPYCRNHDDVITLIEKYMGHSEIKQHIDTLLEQMRERFAVFDLEALLIKPVQRILKYPLLLNALIKTTDEDHPDKKEILSAINAMTDVATAINEYKRRKDLVYKYKKETDTSIGDKLAKLSLHSIKKKSSRIRERFSANLGFIDQTRDENFDQLETRHRNLEKTIKIFVKDVQQYMDQMQDIINSMECMVTDIDDFYGEKRGAPEVQRYQSVYTELQGQFFPTFRVEVDDLVIQPLIQLVQSFDGPNKVIQKRYDKLLDYDNMSRKAKDDKVTEKTVQVAKQNYEALNAQLLDELPRLYSLAFQLFSDCMGSFVRAQREYMNSLLKHMYPLMDLQFLAEESTMEVFTIRHTTIVDRLAVLSFMPRNFSPRVAESKPDKKSKRSSQDQSSAKSVEVQAQSDSQKVYVTQQYAGKLYRVGQMHVAIDMMDVSLCEGEVVGVIKEQDPMGNKERWFVDNGAKKGFIPKKILIPYEQSPARTRAADSADSVSPGSLQQSRNIALLQQLQEEDGDMDFALEEDMTPSIPLEPGGQGSSGVTQSDHAYVNQAVEEDDELYYAEYAFQARSPNEVSLFEHQVVSVLAKHDLEGNLEWWYVDADGKTGYTPAAYLKKMEAHGSVT